MLTFLKAKLATLVIGLVATTTVVGTATVVAAKNHVGPLASAPIFSQSGTDDHDHPHTPAHLNADEQEIIGIVQSLDTTQHVFTVLPEGQTQSISVHYDNSTHIEQEQAAFTVQAKVHVEIQLLTDMTWYAHEIKTLTLTPSQTSEHDEQKFAGVVQSVNVSEKSFILLPAGMTNSVTIVYDATTKLEQDKADTQSDPATLVGKTVLVDVVVRADHVFYAKEIDVVKANKGNDDGTATSGSDDTHHPASSPTPSSSSGDDHKGTPSPTSSPDHNNDHSGDRTATPHP